MKVNVKDGKIVSMEFFKTEQVRKQVHFVSNYFQSKNAIKVTEIVVVSSRHFDSV